MWQKYWQRDVLAYVQTLQVPGKPLGWYFDRADKTDSPSLHASCDVAHMRNAVEAPWTACNKRHVKQNTDHRSNRLVQSGLGCTATELRACQAVSISCRSAENFGCKKTSSSVL